MNRSDAAGIMPVIRVGDDESIPGSVGPLSTIAPAGTPNNQFTPTNTTPNVAAATASRLTAGVMGQLSPHAQQHLVGEVRQALSQFEGPHGLVAPAELLLGVGSK